MQELVITIAAPVFVILILLEMLVGHLRGKSGFYFSDTLNSMGLGMMYQISSAFVKLLSIGIYAWVAQHAALLELPDAWWIWPLALLGYDFLYYWLHRCGHEIAVLWAAHVVHHQSERYNLTTALRQTSSGALLSWIFYLPLAILGVPVKVFVAVALIDLLYQFWVHTELIGRLGWFDRVFVSPSNHRVHHATNDIYLDRNYGGILILWDRLFGTFIEEQDAQPVVYGTRSPLRSWNPIKANIEVYQKLITLSGRTTGWRDKIRIWLKHPGWQPDCVTQQHPEAPFDLHRARYEPALPGSWKIYSLIQFLLLLLITTHFLAVVPTARPEQSLPYALWLGAGLCILGGLTEQRLGYLWLESARLILTALFVLSGSQWFGPCSLNSVQQAGVLLLALCSLLGLIVLARDRQALPA